MTITCIVGNGFDIGLGLKTKFTDFIDLHYLQMKRTENTVLRRFQKLLLEDKQQADENRRWRHWSNAEREFGCLDLPVLDSKDPFADFGECLKDFKYEFGLFLKKQNDAIAVPQDKEQKLYETLCRSVLGVGQKLRPKYRRAFFDQYVPAAQNVELNFITFNYTDILERITNARKRYNENSLLGVDLGNNVKRNVRINRIHHVHGHLGSDMIFGVNDLSQIANEAVRKGCDEHKWFVKSVVDDLMGNENEIVAKSMIEKSSMVIVLGMSFGETDKSWWELLFRRAFTDRMPLIPCVYQEKEGHPVLPEETKLYEDQYATMFSTINEGTRNGVIRKNMHQCMNLVLPASSCDPDGKSVWCDPFNLSWIHYHPTPDGAG